ncbi:hypothetical protein D3C71_1729030 [compost metagenome]
MAGNAALEGVQLIGQVAQLGNHRFNPLSQQDTTVRWGHAPIITIEQDGIQLLFQFADRFGHGGLGQIQFPSRTRNRLIA